MLMKIRRNGEVITIQGDPQLTNTQVSAQTLWKSALAEDDMYWLQMEVQIPGKRSNRYGNQKKFRLFWTSTRGYLTCLIIYHFTGRRSTKLNKKKAQNLYK